MTLNNSYKAVVDTRRVRVSQLLLRGFTQREIESRLFKEGIINPKTEKPFSLGTVNGDVKFLENQWREEAAAEIAEHKARQMAENKELRRRAWTIDDLTIVLRSLQFESSLIGTEAPKRQEVSWQENLPAGASIADAKNAKALLARIIAEEENNAPGD